MDIQFVPIPSDNFTVGRRYYWTKDNFLHLRVGRLATVDKVIMHWMAGNLAGADREFSRAGAQKSAHFGIEDTTVHQYVKMGDTSYNSGVGSVNSEAIGIEHSAEPGRDATDATYETSAQVLAMIFRQMGWSTAQVSSIRFRLHKHSEFIPTSCPGSLDLDRIAQRTWERINEATHIPIEVDQPITANAIPATLASAEIHHFAPFLTNLEPSQVFSEEAGRVQDFLVAKGFMEDPGTNRGYYGPKTQGAVAAFQKKNGISSSPAYFGWWYERTRQAANTQL